MRLDVYVNYRGNCEQAFRFYEQHLGGKITGMIRHGEQPNPGISADWKEKILHARMEIGTTVLMGADITRCDPHRVIVTGPCRLRGERVESPDIRAGMAMLIAALCAEGRSEIGNIGQIDRGYERIDERLRDLGARIERVATEPVFL